MGIEERMSRVDRMVPKAGPVGPVAAPAKRKVPTFLKVKSKEEGANAGSEEQTEKRPRTGADADTATGGDASAGKSPAAADASPPATSPEASPGGGLGAGLLGYASDDDSESGD